MRPQRLRKLLLFSLTASSTIARSIPDNSDHDLAGAAANQQSSTNANGVASDPAGVINPKSPPASSQKTGGGTKDAPVDGLDGKPHAGPWVVVDSKKASGGSSSSISEGDNTKSSSAETLARLEKEGYGTVKNSEEGWGLIPEKNDGVMDDKNRAAPRKGTTGTEGGVTEKSKQETAKEMRTGEKFEKRPSQPKEAPPLPHSEQQQIKVKDGKASKVSTADAAIGVSTPAPASIETVSKAVGGLQKPIDLPETPHDTSKASKMTDHDPPVQIGQSKTDKTTSRPPVAKAATEEAENLIQPAHSFMLAFVMILFSEIGDKTFLVAALMAMRHDRLIVFSAAFSALIAMTVLSAVVGHAVPTLFPRRLVAFAAAFLFLIFGAKLLREGLNMPKDSGVGEEMQEVEAELEEKEELARRSGRRTAGVTPYMLESGHVRRSASRGRVCLPEKARSPSSSGSERSRSPSQRSSLPDMLGGLNNLLSLILSPAWVQTFVMTFLGEWGDRSQIATVAMAAGQDYWWVTGGAVVGHMICTGVAVLGGRALAGRVSMRIVTIGGALAFLAFGLIYFVEALFYEGATTTG